MPPSADSYHPASITAQRHVLGQMVNERGNGASLCPRLQYLSQHQLDLLGHENDGRALFTELQDRLGVPPRIGSLTEPGCIDTIACASGIGNQRYAPRRAACAHGPRLDNAVCNRVVLLRHRVECDAFLEIHCLSTRSRVVSYRHDFGPVLELRCIGEVWLWFIFICASVSSWGSNVDPKLHPHVHAWRRRVLPGAHRTCSIRLLRGRIGLPRCVDNAVDVALLNPYIIQARYHAFRLRHPCPLERKARLSCRSRRQSATKAEMR